MCHPALGELRKAVAEWRSGKPRFQYFVRGLMTERDEKLDAALTIFLREAVDALAAAQWQDELREAVRRYDADARDIGSLVVVAKRMLSGDAPAPARFSGDELPGLLYAKELAAENMDRNFGSGCTSDLDVDLD